MNSINAVIQEGLRRDQEPPRHDRQHQLHAREPLCADQRPDGDGHGLMGLHFWRRWQRHSPDIAVDDADSALIHQAYLGTSASRKAAAHSIDTERTPS